MNDIPSGLSVGAVMTKDPVSIETSQSLHEAYQMMDKFSCRHLGVTENDTLVGVLSQRDLTLAESVTKRSRMELKVDEAYIAYPYRAEPGDRLEKVLDDMLTLEIGSVLIVENDNLVGILTMSDVCRILKNLLEDKPIMHS